MSLLTVLGVVAAALLAAMLAAMSVLVLTPRRVSAHCDTLEGPTARDGRVALETRNVNHALKWIDAEGEAELREIFDRAVAAAAEGPVAREVAERWFLENLVRIHRAGEGAPYTGLQPVGTQLDARVAAADLCVDLGTLEPLRALVDPGQFPELERRFADVLARQGFDVDDLVAARAYIAAYVRFFKYAEGHDHDHAHAHEHAHAH
jgi:hypothetical protein